MNTRLLFPLFAFLALAACGGGGGDDDGPSPAAGYSISGTVYKGPLRNAAVSVHSLQADGSDGAVLGSGTTGEDGAFEIADIGASDTNCIAVLATGGSFVDETTGATVTLVAGESLGAAICNANDDVAGLAITPLTHAALARARRLAAGGAALATAVSSSNVSVAQQWGLVDVTGVVPLNPLEEQTPADDVAARIAQLEQMQYALVIAGLSDVADNNGVDVMDFVAGVAMDAADGLLDGTDDGTQITLPADGGSEVPLSASQSLTDVQASVDALIASVPPSNGVQQVFVPTLPLPLGNDGTSSLGISTPSIPAFVDGSPGSFTLTATGGTPPYQWSLTGGTLPEGLTLSVDGVISGTVTLAPGSSMSVTGPLYIQVQDALGATALIPFALTVVSGPPSVDGDAAPTGYVDVPFVTQYSAVGGVPPYSFTLASGTGFPPIGVFLNAGGDLAGTPSAAGTSSFGVCATDLVGATNCMDVTMTVEEAPEASGSWSGTYNRTGPGDGGCTYQSAGALEFDIATVDGVNYTGDSFVSGIMLRYIEGCVFAYYTSNTGTATLTLGADGRMTGEVAVYIYETGSYHTLHLDGMLDGDTIAGDVYNGAHDTIEGSFEVTRQ